MPLDIGAKPGPCRILQHARVTGKISCRRFWPNVIGTKERLIPRLFKAHGQFVRRGRARPRSSLTFTRYCGEAICLCQSPSQRWSGSFLEGGLKGRVFRQQIYRTTGFRFMRYCIRNWQPQMYIAGKLERRSTKVSRDYRHLHPMLW
jgi:hypothetical protein